MNAISSEMPWAWSPSPAPQGRLSVQAPGLVRRPAPCLLLPRCRSTSKGASSIAARIFSGVEGIHVSAILTTASALRLWNMSIRPCPGSYDQTDAVLARRAARAGSRWRPRPARCRGRGRCRLTRRRSAGRLFPGSGGAVRTCPDVEPVDAADGRRRARLTWDASSSSSRRHACTDALGPDHEHLKSALSLDLVPEPVDVETLAQDQELGGVTPALSEVEHACAAGAAAIGDRHRSFAFHGTHHSLQASAQSSRRIRRSSPRGGIRSWSGRAPPPAARCRRRRAACSAGGAAARAGGDGARLVLCGRRLEWSPRFGLSTARAGVGWPPRTRRSRSAGVSAAFPSAATGEASGVQIWERITRSCA